MTGAPPSGGMCYVNSARYVLENPDAIYREGVVINSRDGKPMGHAFVRLPSGDIFDAATGLTIPSEVYYALGSVTNVHELTADALRNKLLTEGRYGSFFNLCER